MNKLTIIGNLTRDPELRTTQSGISVCTFSVAVNRKRRNNGDQPEADFFKVVAWRQLGENCAKFLSKGSKVCAVGAVELKSYTDNNGTARYNMEVTAEDIEFLSNKSQNAERGDADDSGMTYTPPADQKGGFTAVETDELPF